MRLTIVLLFAVLAPPQVSAESAAHADFAHHDPAESRSAAVSTPWLNMTPVGAVSLSWMSNLLLRDPAERLPIEDDLIASLRLGALFSAGDEDSRLMFHVTPGVQVLRLNRFRQFDSTSPTLDADAHFDDGVLKVGLQASHEETSLPTERYPTYTLHRTSIIDHAGVIAEHDTTDATTLLMFLNFDSRDYSGPTFHRPPHYRTTSASLEARYRPTELLTVGPGLRTTRRDSGGLAPTDDVVAYLWASWEFSPAIHIGSRTGIGATQVPTRPDPRWFGFVSLEATAQVRDTLAFALTGSHDLDVNLDGSLIIRNEAALSARWFPREDLTTSAQLSWESHEPFESRFAQSAIRFSLTQRVDLSERLAATASVARLVNSGRWIGSNYANTTLGVSLQVRW